MWGKHSTELCVKHDLFILVGEQVEGKYIKALQNKINYNAVSRKCRRSLEELHKRRGADVTSYHEILEVMMRLKMYREKDSEIEIRSKEMM